MYYSTTTTTTPITPMLTKPWISVTPRNGNCKKTPFFGSRLTDSRILRTPRKGNCKRTQFLSSLNSSYTYESVFHGCNRLLHMPRKGICKKTPFLGSLNCFHTSGSFFNPLKLDTQRLQIPRKGNCKKMPFLESTKCYHTSDSFCHHSMKKDGRNCESSIAGLATTEILETSNPKSNAADRLECLVSEFKSLSESIDRVKRLLNYAAILPPFDESSRLDSNRVLGCTTQVWLEVKMDDFGLMRFRADSDSEITKGFCSCLIWLLDMAEPEEVLTLKTEDLADVNVGLTSTARSRVNTWHNVLISMQKRTKDLVEKRDWNRLPLLASDGINAYANYSPAQEIHLPPIKLDVKEPVNAQEKKIGMIVNFYREPILNAILIAARNLWPYICLYDFAIRADSGATEVNTGCQFFTAPGFLDGSENVHAILDQTRSRKAIIYWIPNGCHSYSLEDSAASLKYVKFLEAAARSFPVLFA